MLSSKSDIRSAALLRRDAISEVERIENALALANHIDALAIEPGQIAAAYWPIRSEIDPRPLLFALNERGVRSALPIVVDGSLIFRELTRTTELVPAGFGTFAPGDDTRAVVPDVLLMPLSAFDSDGNRLGYGRGFYDRTIASLRGQGLDPRLIGLAHAAQEADAIPAEPHDIALHAILCETGLRSISSSMADLA